MNKYTESQEENFVIGGGAIYKMLLPYTKKLYITKINEDFDGDTFFPKIDEEEWKIVERKEGIKNERNPYEYEYVTYERK